MGVSINATTKRTNENIYYIDSLVKLIERICLLSRPVLVLWNRKNRSSYIGMLLLLLLLQRAIEIFPLPSQRNVKRHTNEYSISKFIWYYSCGYFYSACQVEEPLLIARNEFSRHRRAILVAVVDVFRLIEWALAAQCTSIRYMAVRPHRTHWNATSKCIYVCIIQSFCVYVER